MDWPHEIANRMAPATDPAALTPAQVGAVVVVALAAVCWSQSWLLVRPVVTLVHELGHALAGMAVGRRFTGFVLRADMSGHAVTVGPNRRGPLAATTWAGYPAPALVAGVIGWLALLGWGAPVLTMALVVLVACVIQVRSAFTGIVVAVAAAAIGAAWWWRSDLVQTQLLLGAATILLAGGWRHLIAVARTRDSGSDPRRMAALTGIPGSLWTTSWAVVTAAVTWLLARTLLALA